MQKKAQRQMQEEEKKESALKAKMEKQLLLEEEEKELQAAKIKAASKGGATGKKAKQYDAAEAQKKALMKSMQKMMNAEPVEGE